MCHMAYYPPGVMPEWEHLIKGARADPHGHSGTLVDQHGTTMIGSKAMNADVAVSQFMEMRRRYPWHHAVFHSRYATGTAINLDNCHPFSVGGDRRTVVYHNGYLFPVTAAERSDTAVFATILSRYNVKDPAVKATLEDRMGFSKAVILSTDPAREPVTILNEQLGITLEDGAWHSNADFTGTTHIIPGTCSSCGEDVPGDDVICIGCIAAAAVRRELLMQDF